MKETGMRFIMQYTMGLSQSFVTQKKIYTHTPTKNAVILKGNMGITHMVSPVYWQFFYFSSSSSA